MGQNLEIDSMADSQIFRPSCFTRKSQGFCSLESHIFTDFTYYIYTKLATLPSRIFFGYIVFRFDRLNPQSNRKEQEADRGHAFGSTC